MAFLLKFVGGKLGAAWLIAALAAGGWGLWQSKVAGDERERADELVADKALLTERLSQVAVTANQNAANHLAAIAENQRREAELADERRARAALRAEFEQRLASLREATREASPEYRACMRIPAPDGVLDAVWLRVGADGASAPGGRDADGDRVPDAAEGPPPPL